MRCLMCVSNFPYAHRTVRFGSLVARGFEAEVTLLTVRSPEENEAAGRSVLEQAASLMDKKPAARKIRRGNPAREILHEIQTGAYDLVIIGANDKPSVSELLLGSVARRIISGAPISTLVIRQPSEKLDDILMTTAGQESSLVTLRFVAPLAKATGARVTMLYVSAAPPSMYAGLNRIDEDLEELLKSDTPIARNLVKGLDLYQDQGIEANLELRHGVAAEEILRAIELEDFSLVVVGSTLVRGINRFFLDEISLQIADHAPRAVLVVHKKPPRPRRRIRMRKRR